MALLSPINRSFQPISTSQASKSNKMQEKKIGSLKAEFLYHKKHPGFWIIFTPKLNGESRAKLL